MNYSSTPICTSKDQVRRLGLDPCQVITKYPNNLQGSVQEDQVDSEYFHVAMSVEDTPET